MYLGVILSVTIPPNLGAVEDLTMLIQDGYIDVVTQTSVDKYSNKIDKDTALMDLFNTDLGAFGTIVSLVNFEMITAQDRKLGDAKDLKSNVESLVEKGKTLVSHYLSLFQNKEQGEISSTDHISIGINQISPVLKTIGISELNAAFARLTESGDADLLDKQLAALRLSQDKLSVFLIEMEKIINLIESIERNYFDISTLEHIENIWNISKIHSIYTAGVQADPNTFTFEIKIQTVKQTESRKNYKPVQVFNYVLSNNFFGNSLNDNVYPYDCTGKFCMRSLGSRCVIDLGSTNVSHIITNCILNKGYKNVEVCSSGILIYSDQNPTTAYFYILISLI